MHIPDGFFNAGTSLGAAGISAGVLGIAVRKTRDVLTDKAVPLAGLTAAFIFAVQMLNFPVAAGTSGHLLGGALAAVLVGPWTACICVAVVLLVQALFADGGLSALGLNVLLIAIVPAFAGWVVFVALRAALPTTRSAIAAASGIAAAISVPIAAACFTVLYAIGGTADVAFGSLAVAMIGTHILIGIGEGVITALTVGSVLATRPDLVYGAPPGVVPLELRAATTASHASNQIEPA
jgi:cobalt/nickel transport system permease protein